MSLPTEGKLPDFRISTTGGRSVSRADFKGRPALFVGWASWHPSRESLPKVEKFHREHGRDVQVASIAFDVEGPGRPMARFTAAKCSHLPLIDATFVLDRLWGADDLPFWVLVDDGGCIQATGREFDAKKVLAALKREPKHHKDGKKAKAEHRFEEFEYLVQQAGIVLSRKRVDDAVAALGKAAKLKPRNRMVLPQAEAIRNPEKVYRASR